MPIFTTINPGGGSLGTDGYGNLLLPSNTDVTGSVTATQFGFWNTARMTEGTFDNSRGARGGISLFCTVDYELNWQAGHLSNRADGTYQPLFVDSDILGQAVSTTKLSLTSGCAQRARWQQKDNTEVVWSLNVDADNSDALDVPTDAALKLGMMTKNTTGDSTGYEGIRLQAVNSQWGTWENAPIVMTLDCYGNYAVAGYVAIGTDLSVRGIYTDHYGNINAPGIFRSNGVPVGFGNIIANTQTNLPDFSNGLLRNEYGDVVLATPGVDYLLPTGDGSLLSGIVASSAEYLAVEGLFFNLNGGNPGGEGSGSWSPDAGSGRDIAIGSQNGQTYLDNAGFHGNGNNLNFSGLSTSDPGIAGAPWNNSGVLMISAG